MANNKITLDSIIKRYINEIGDEFKHDYRRYLQILIDGLDELNFDISGMPKYLECDLGDDRTIPIPEDSVNITGVHIASPNGNWIHLSSFIPALWIQRPQTRSSRNSSGTSILTTCLI